jgi:hypothetical protein
MRLLTPSYNKAGETGIPKIESVQFPPAARVGIGLLTIDIIHSA